MVYFSQTVLLELCKYCTFTPVSGPLQAPVFNAVTEGDITGSGTTRDLSLTWTFTEAFSMNISQFVLTQDQNIHFNVTGDMYSKTVRGLAVGQRYDFTVRADTVCMQAGNESALVSVNLPGLA